MEKLLLVTSHCSTVASPFLSREKNQNLILHTEAREVQKLQNGFNTFLDSAAAVGRVYVSLNSQT